MAAVDDFSTTTPLPSRDRADPGEGQPRGASLQRRLPAHGELLEPAALGHPELSLPNVSAGQHQQPQDPGTAIDNAYKAAFIYTRIVQVGEAPFSGANNYAYLLNHDLPGILANRFEEGDFTDAQSLLLNGRISEASNFNELGANWYWDGPWRTPVAWAAYLEGTNDTAFVASTSTTTRTGRASGGRACTPSCTPTTWRSSARRTGYLKRSDDNDSERHLAVRRRDRAGRPGRLQVHRHPDRQHGRGAVGRRRVHQPAERRQRGPVGQRAGQRLRLPAVRGQRPGHRRPVQLARATRTGPARTSGARTSGTSCSRAAR